MDRAVERMLDSAAGCYAAAGRVAKGFASGKLRHDPMYAALLRLGCLPDRGVLADLGCGRGLLLALIAAASEQFGRGDWPAGWPPPPSQLALHGYDVNAAHVTLARRVLDGRARITLQDVRETRLPPCTAVALLDVLFYLDPDAQEQVLLHAAMALEPGGVLLLREADAAHGLAFLMTRWSERTLEALRGRPRGRLYYRSAREWVTLLSSLGLAVRTEPMSTGTPFANVLFVCRKAVTSDG
jgi:SAM-dependent methyltransferase